MSVKDMERRERNEALGFDPYDRIATLEAENLRLQAVLEDGCDLGLAPDECAEALSKCKDRKPPSA